MTVKDYFTITVSIIALIVSLYNFYLQQIRRREKLIGSMISIGMVAGKWDHKMEYSVSNVGDVQLVLKEAEYSSNHGIFNTEVRGLPVILKPGEMALFDILFKGEDLQSGSSEIVELAIFSATGKGYRLPHVHRVNGKTPKNDGMYLN
ncbi:hypothetical protein [Vibrio sp. 624788]|uniref:hypothetical protein n=1 Tax=Vibrio sp. 624788 TaxID=1234362 RepID=UPI00037C7715|nr:hypothetical protein [Vibrio sp. 624788]